MQHLFCQALLSPFPTIWNLWRKKNTELVHVAVNGSYTESSWDQIIFDKKSFSQSAVAYFIQQLLSLTQLSVSFFPSLIIIKLISRLLSENKCKTRKTILKNILTQFLLQKLHQFNGNSDIILTWRFLWYSQLLECMSVNKIEMFND